MLEQAGGIRWWYGGKTKVGSERGMEYKPS